MTRDTYFITTPIYYVNDRPHIGHAYTSIAADVLARWKRLEGKRVFFLTGTDEHGQKVEKAARDAGEAPKPFTDRVSRAFRELTGVIGLSNDDFIRTTEERHYAACQALWQRLVEAGDIYLGHYEGWYAVRDEAFYGPDELTERDGVKYAPSGAPVEWVREPSYFFRLSRWLPELLRRYDLPEGHPERISIAPETRKNEVAAFIRQGLQEFGEGSPKLDLSVSRTSFRWGVPVPGDPDHVMYVWLDALTNYITAAGYPSDPERFAAFWPADLHMVGKDILRFHCVYWPAFLLSAGLPLPRQVWGHGWWLKDDKKMSKSVGNVVRPDELIRRFGADPLRYFLLREMTFGQDASFSDEAFLKRYNADLANGLGNTAARVLAMARRYFAGRTPATACGESVVATKAEEVVTRYREAMDGYEFHRALEAAWELLATVDGYVNEKAPWSLARREGASSPALQRILYNCLEGVRLVATMAAPVMPQACRRLLAQLGEGEPVALDVALRWGGLATEQLLGDEDTLFPRADAAEYFGEVKVNETTASQHAAASDAAPAPADEGQIGIEEFARVKLVVGTVKVAERVPKSSKLIRMEVDLGEPSLRQIVAGIGKQYTPEQLVNRQIVVVSNLKPAVLMGVASNGMVLAASVDGAAFLLSVDQPVPAGTEVR